MLHVPLRGRESCKRGKVGEQLLVSESSSTRATLRASMCPGFGPCAWRRIRRQRAAGLRKELCCLLPLHTLWSFSREGPG